MIAREIMKDPVAFVATFDWFNDFKDTRSWLSRQCMTCAYSAEILRLLDAAHDIHVRKEKLKPQ